jgi:hypothetical protein
MCPASGGDGWATGKAERQGKHHRTGTSPIAVLGPGVPSARILSARGASVLHGVDDLGEEESHFGRDRAPRVSLLDEVEALVHGGESELTVEQDDVIGVDLGAGRELQSSASPFRAATAVAACRTTSDGMNTASRSRVARVAS